jgi:O-antigen ligase
MVEINWTRWFVYLVVGVPSLTWVLFTKNNVQRLLAVLGILVFVEGLFTWRRNFIAIGVGTSVIFVYIALMGLYLQRGRFPSLGAQGFLWLAFLFAASIGAMMGSLGTGLLLFNIRDFQEYYFEGAFYFLVGMMAFDRDEDVNRFLHWFVVLIGGGAAALHILFLVIGWRPPGFEYTGAVVGSIEFIGGAFPHPNTQADFLAMVLPITLLIFLRGRSGGANRLLVGAVLTAMTISLLLTGGRGGILATAVMIGVAVSLSGERLGRTVQVSLLGVFAVAGASLIGIYLLPQVFKEAFGYLAEEGLETNRFRTWSQFSRMLADHPFGVGLPPENILAIGDRYGTGGLSNAHSIYLNIAVKTGVMGLLAFLALVGSVLGRAWRVLRVTRDPQARQATLFLFLAICGFLLGGAVEPIYTNGFKLNHLLWLLVGLSLATSRRAMAAAREARLGLDSGAGLLPQHAFREERSDHA